MDLGIVAYRMMIKIVKNRVRGKFHANWTPIDVKKVGDRFHKNFQTCLRIDQCKYMGANLGCTTWVQ